jgi:hypothetical protein
MRMPAAPLPQASHALDARYLPGTVTGDKGDVSAWAGLTGAVCVPRQAPGLVARAPLLSGFFTRATNNHPVVQACDDAASRPDEAEGENAMDKCGDGGRQQRHGK